MSTLRINLFFDFTCPFSYVTEAALARRAARGGLEVRARALELFPAPEPLRPPGEDPGWEAEARPLAERLGLPLRPPGFRPRTRKAHEAAAFAAERGAGDAFRAAALHAYWAEGTDLGRIDALVALGEAVGLDPQEMRIALDIDLHREAVLRDEALAARLRVTRVPTLFLGSGPGARVLVGAQTPETLETAILNYEC